MLVPENSQRATMQMPQRVDEQHGGELFSVSAPGLVSSQPSFSQTQENLGADRRGQKFEYVGFISRADAEFVARMV
jgi:hypothetical protein